MWQLAVWFGSFPAFILPSPAQVGVRFVQTIMDGSLLRNTLVTLVEVLAGLALGVSVATVLGYLLARSICILNVCFLHISLPASPFRLLPSLLCW